jgi:hypothetical protein
MTARGAFVGTAVLAGLVATVGANHHHPHHQVPVPHPTVAQAVAAGAAGGDGWMVLVVVVLIIVCGVGAVCAYLRHRPSPLVVSAPTHRRRRQPAEAPRVHHRWHVILEGYHRGVFVGEVRRGPVEMPATTEAEVAAEVVARYLDVYGPLDPAAKVVARVTKDLSEPARVGDPSCATP